MRQFKYKVTVFFSGETNKNILFCHSFFVAVIVVIFSSRIQSLFDWLSFCFYLVTLFWILNWFRRMKYLTWNTETMRHRWLNLQALRKKNFSLKVLFFYPQNEDNNSHWECLAKTKKATTTTTTTLNNKQQIKSSIKWRVWNKQ